MIKSPDLLRSETFALEKLKYEMLGEKGKEVSLTVIEAETLEKPKENKLLEGNKDTL